MSFEPRLKQASKPTKQRIVKMADKKEPSSSTFQGASSGMSFEPRLKETTKETTKQRIVKMAEKKEPVTSTFQRAGSGMSYEPRLKDTTKTTTKQRIVKMAENEEPASSTFQSAGSDMSFEPRLKQNASNTSERKVAVASGSVLFQQGTKKATFESDGSQFVYQTPKEKRLLLTKKVAAQMFKPQESKPATFETDDSGMNMVVKAKSVKKPPVATTKPPTTSVDQPRGLPKNTDNGGMKMASFVSNEFSKQSSPAFGNIQQSKFDVNSAKKTAEDIQKLAKFVSDGLQMVYTDSQQKKAVVTTEEARRQKKERDRKKVFGFEIGPSEEELALQMLDEGKHLAMEGGKHFAKFASDGMQMVYRAAEKQTKEYIASKQSVTTKKESPSIEYEKPKNAAIEPIAPTPFYAAIDITKTDEKVEPKTSASATNSPKPFFATSNDSEEMQPKSILTADNVKRQNIPVSNDSPNPFFAAAQDDHRGRNEVKTEGSKPASNDELSTSSILRSGGRMFAKFVGDGLQMVQRVAKQKEGRYRRPPK